MMTSHSSTRSFWIKLGSLLMVFALCWTSVAVSQTSYQLVGSTPPDQAENIELEQIFQIQFDQELPDVNALQVNGTTEDSIFAIRVSQNNNVNVQTSPAPEPQLAFDLQGNTLLLQPTEELLPSITYRITVPTQQTLTLSQPVELTFTTKPEFSYEQDVQPLLDVGCVGCHRPGGTQSASPLDTYQAALAYITPGDQGSALLDPQWTTRHASNFGSTTNLDQTSVGGDVTTSRGINTDFGGGVGTRGSTNDVGGGIGFRSGVNPALAYVREMGYNPEDLGQWTPDQVEVVATWIIQDDAAESAE